MGSSNWTYSDLDDKDLLSRIEGKILQPLISAPINTFSATTKTIGLVGSRSRLQVDRMKKLTKSIIDSEEREKVYGVEYRISLKRLEAQYLERFSGF